MELISIIDDLDHALSTNKAFSLSDATRARENATAMMSATSWSFPPSASSMPTPNVDSQSANFYEYDARNQITLCGSNGEISDYASKSLGGLMTSY